MVECPKPPDNSEQVESLYPDGTRPEIRLDSLSALCSYGMTTTVMTGALRQTLCQIFSNPLGILNSSLRGRIAEKPWSADPATTGIIIESLNVWKPTLAERRPTLLLKSGAWKWSRVGLGNQAGADELSGTQYYYGHWEGSHTIFAIAQEPGEADILATEVAKLMLWYANPLAISLGLIRFALIGKDEIGVLQESTDYYVVPVSVAYIVPEVWSLTPEAPVLKRLVFTSSHVLGDY